MASNRTTSVVDISEIEDDDEEVAAIQQQPLAPAAACAAMPASAANVAHCPRRAESAAHSPAQLYLYHEDLAPQQRISSLLSSMSNLQPPAAHATSRSADNSPGQTLGRPLPGLQAIDYQPGAQQQGRLSPATRSMGAAGHHHGVDGFGLGGAGAADGCRTPGPGPGDTTAPAEQQANKANLGTLTGVYFPCVQNIFGVILFIRMVWIVGTAGVPTAFALVFICCAVTFTTSISLSAIATNGIVPAGGSYFMISRSLGPECGGAVGILFFLGTTVAGAMYITGAVEIMLNYMAPSWGLFGDFQRDVNILYNNIRVYGTLLLIIVGLMVWIGVKFVSKLAPVALFCVLFSIFSIYLGIFINYQGRPDLVLCVVGDRLVTLKNIPFDLDPAAQGGQVGAAAGGQLGSNGAEQWAAARNQSLPMTAEELARMQLRRSRALCTTEKLRYIFCPNTLASNEARRLAGKLYSDNAGQPLDGAGEQGSDALASAGGQQDERQQQHQNQQPADEQQLMRDLFKRPPNMANCDPYFSQNSARIHLERAVPGISSGILFRNLKPRFRDKGTIVGYDEGAATSERSGLNYIYVDITTTFTILISIYFPSCTGILAGSNRSGDLADAQRSIPRGTIAAQLTTSFVYLSSIVLFGSTFNNLFIRDKFGESMGGQLAVTQIAWPEPSFILVGGLLSTLGASLQSLVGAPRILQGIAKDDVIPCFGRFAKLSARGEPETAIIFTLLIAELAVLIGNLDFIAPILTISLVMCYFFINLACTLHSLLGSPNWRPRFKFYHWSFSLLGCLLCLFVMLVSSWVYFLVAILLASCIYKYIEFAGARKEWGDGKQGLALSAATYNLLRLGTQEPHTKNWRPQLLLFTKLKPRLELEPPFSKAQKNNRQQAAAALVQAAANAGHELVDLQQADASSSQQLQQLAVAHPKLLTFASQLKAGQGLTLVSSVIEGDYQQCGDVAHEARRVLQAEIQRERVRGIADVLVTPSIQDGLCYQIQTAGLGGLKHNTVILGWPEHWRKPLLLPKPELVTAPPPAGQGTGAGVSSTGGSRRAGSGGSSLRGRHSHPHSQHQQQQLRPPNKTRAHLFIDLMRNVQVSQNALLVVKGVDSWPESCDKLGGTIDVWWIVNDGGLLMLLPHLLRQHRSWKACQLRIFTIAQASDSSEQMREDLAKFLYHLRIEAKVDIVVMRDTEISDYAYERTLMMEQRGEIIKRLSTNRKQSILLEQEVDGGRLIRFRIRKPSIYDFEETIPFLASPASASLSNIADENCMPMAEIGPPPPPPGAEAGHSGAGSQLQSPTSGQAAAATATVSDGAAPNSNPLANLRPDEANVRRMHTALSLNEVILKRSKAAKLVIINLPGAPKESTAEAENNYMEFIEVLTDKLERVLLVQNGGREVITIHS